MEYMKNRSAGGDSHHCQFCTLFPKDRKLGRVYSSILSKSIKRLFNWKTHEVTSIKIWIKSALEIRKGAGKILSIAVKIKSSNRKIMCNDQIYEFKRLGNSG